MADLLKSLTNSVKHWYVPLILGIIFIVFGIYIFTAPLETYLTLAWLFSVSFIVSGVGEIFFALRNTKHLRSWGWYLISGLLSLVIGIYLLSNPQSAAATLPFVVGFTILFRSFQLLGLAFSLREMGRLRWGNLAVSSTLGIVFSFLLILNPVFSGGSLVVFTALSFISTGIASVVLSFDLKKVKNKGENLSDELKQKIKELENEIDDEMKG